MWTSVNTKGKLQLLLVGLPSCANRMSNFCVPWPGAVLENGICQLASFPTAGTMDWQALVFS